MAKVRVLAFDIGIKNFSFCLCEGGSTWKAFEVLQWERTELKGTTNVDLLIALDTVLNGIKLDFDAVEIEQQPFCRSSTQLTCQLLAHSIFMFYSRQKKSVKFQHATNKFRCSNNPDFRQLAKTNKSIQGSANYSTRKRYAIKFVTELIKNTPDSFSAEQSNYFINAFKQDDLADSLMIALYHLQAKKK